MSKISEGVLKYHKEWKNTVASKALFSLTGDRWFEGGKDSDER